LSIEATVKLISFGKPGKITTELKMGKITLKKFMIALISLSVLMAAGVSAGYLFFAKDKTEYITANAVRMDIEESVLASGTLEAVKTVEVGAQVSGQLKKLHVALGERVKKGDLLAEIDPVLQQNSLRDAEAQVENLRAQKRSRQALLRQYELEYQRQKQMVAQDAAARADLESAQAQLESTRADIASLEAQIRKARIAVDTSGANLGYTRIIAPMDGVVVSIVTEEGQTVVSTQSATTILKLANLDTVTVKAEISEADVTRVRPGQKVYFTILGEPDTRIFSTLRAIEPAPEESSSSSGTSSSAGSSTGSSSTAIYYNGLFDVPNPGHKLRVSMTAQVSIVLNEVKKAVCIPVTALCDKGKDGRCEVRVLRNNRPEIRRIRTGVSDNVQVQVIEGLREGEKVVIGDSASVPASTQTSRPPGPPPGR
jgi:macrolide-specific efflux system membrane fusion protein